VHSLLLFLNGISNTLLLLRQSEIMKSQIFTGYDTPKIMHVLIKIIDLIGSNFFWLSLCKIVILLLPLFITKWRDNISYLRVYLWAGVEQDCFRTPRKDWDLQSLDLKDSKYMFLWNDGLPGYNVNVSDDQQLEFRSLGEFYIVIFLNKLKIVENTPKNEKI
jgi:hypothetical protein